MRHMQACRRFCWRLFKITEQERKNERVFSMDEVADDLDSCFVETSRKQVNFGRETEDRFRNNWKYERYQQRPQGNRSPQRPTYRSVIPYTNRSYEGNKSYKRRGEDSYRNRSPSYQREKETNYGFRRNRQRSQSKSPVRSYNCWNCGEDHPGGASTCTVCLICGNSNQPTRECKNKRKTVQNKRGVNATFEEKPQELYDSEFFL